MSSSFGTLFRITTFGESHGTGIGAVIDGCPPKITLRETDIQAQLDRRRPSQSSITTTRNEPDRFAIWSGVQNHKTLGTPIALTIENRDHRPVEYGPMHAIPRPSHADYTYRMKYGTHALSGGGRASARETVARVAAGAIAEQFLAAWCGIEIVAWVSAVATIEAPSLDASTITREMVDTSMIRCPDWSTAQKMIAAVEAAQQDGDSVGGIISCVCRNIPPGLGEPVFHKAEALLAQAMLSIPATKGFEIGSGFAGSRMLGSEHNDRFIKKGDRLGTITNHSGGIQGGITNGEPIFFHVAFKPPATIGLPQKTVDFDG
ncbi:MAG: chorismate synthase, partial [Deltaproteobacteria bacterium]